MHRGNVPINRLIIIQLIEEPKNEVNTVDVSIGGEYIVSAGKDAAVRLYDAEVGKVFMSFRTYAPNKWKRQACHDRRDTVWRMQREWNIKTIILEFFENSLL